jgi:VanZ family protein
MSTDGKGGSDRGFTLFNVRILMIGKRVGEGPLTDWQSRQSRFWRYVPLILWMAVIFFASTSEFSASNTALVIQPLLRWLFPHITDERIALFHFLMRKAGHFTEYAILALLAARAFASSHTALRRSWFLAALILVSVYALSDEYHQSFVPSRTASIYDSFIDMAGGLAALVWWRMKRRQSRKYAVNR